MPRLDRRGLLAAGVGAIATPALAHRLPDVGAVLRAGPAALTPGAAP